MSNAAPLSAPATTLAALVWPERQKRSAAVLRGVLLTILGACILTVSAKVQVPGPVPMTLQTLAVVALGAFLGMRLAVLSVVIYIAQGAFGLPVFANTPPQVASFAYLLGPTGGFLLGFVAAAAMVGHAADCGFASRPVRFGLVLTAANVVMIAIGCLWIATIAQTASGSTGYGFVKAYELGFKP